MSFDRTGKCPICHKDFQSQDCPHTWRYVHEVLNAANISDFVKDVIQTKKKNAKYILMYKNMRP